MFFRVNGAAVYARGGNKIPMDLITGRMSAVGHRRLVQTASTITHRSAGWTYVATSASFRRPVQSHIVVLGAPMLQLVYSLCWVDLP